MKQIILILAAIFSTVVINAQTVHVLFTTDVHGSIFPFDFAANKTVNHSMAQAATYIQSVRDTAQNVILLDNGDCLQGTPVVYYYNYVDTTAKHVVPSIYNYLKYDAGSVGNHDIETGHGVYDRVKDQFDMPWLAANAIDKRTGEPYFQPYHIVRKSGKKIAILGLITPHIPHWLPEFLWQNMEFEDMVVSAQKWVNVIKAQENPDAIIGLFHSGYDYTYGNVGADTPSNENASVLVAERVNGIDAILIGHDHKYYCKKHKNPAGDDVLVCDANTAAYNIGHVTMNFDGGKVRCEGEIMDISDVAASADFEAEFAEYEKAVSEYALKVIGTCPEDVYAYESFFGNSTFVDLAHQSMLKYTGADISFSAPLLPNAVIRKGDVRVAQMFDLYRYENMLNVLTLSGAEVVKYLEYSYAQWVSDPAKTGHLLNVSKSGRFRKSFYNFDSAAGIVYTVNPFAEQGKRVKVKSMADGTPFDLDKVYKVAVNSYRFNGGGGHLTQGLGLTKEQVNERLVQSIERDVRGILMDDIKANGGVKTNPLSNWKFVPEDDIKQYIEKDKQLLMK